MDDLSIQVQFLAQRFHDELLEVLGEEFEAVFVGQHHHVFGAAAFSKEIPHQRELRGRIVTDDRIAGGFVAGLGAGEKPLNIQALQGSRQQSNCAQFASAPTHPVPHREGLDPAIGDGCFVQGAAFSRDGHCMSREAQTRPLVSGTCLDHSIAGFRGAAGLGDDQCQGLPQLACQGAEDLVHAIGIGVVEEIGRQLVGMRMA